MKFTEYYLVSCSRVRNSGLALVLTIALVLSPLTMLPSFANNFLNQLEYWNSQSHTSTDNGYRIGVDPNVRFKSKPSGFFKAERVGQEPGKGSVLIWNDCNPKRYAGKRVEFSGYVKTDKMNGHANAFLKVSKGDDVVRFDNMDNRPITKADDWQEFSIVLDVPKKPLSFRSDFSLPVAAPLGSMRSVSKLWATPFQLQRSLGTLLSTQITNGTSYRKSREISISR